ncbi:MAG TPA: hypothetical protein VFU11_07435 [Solirubrobacterales bacterium]|nr:hypothetical protein [Solirubrobacterales bacterium]
MAPLLVIAAATIAVAFAAAAIAWAAVMLALIKRLPEVDPGPGDGRPGSAHPER